MDRESTAVNTADNAAANTAEPTDAGLLEAGLVGADLRVQAGRAGHAAQALDAASAGRGRLGGQSEPRRERLRLLETRVAPAVPAHERVLPLLDEVAALFPDGVLRRGSTVTVSGPGTTSLALAVAAGASAQGSWLGVVGVPDLGWAAAEEIGIDLARVLAVDPEPQDWAYAAAALIGAVDLILVAARRRVAGRDARRLAARARERDSVLICRGDRWPQGADVHLESAAGFWHGLGEGHGLLRSRRVQVTAGGRGAASRPRKRELLLPGPSGAVADTDSSVTMLPGAADADGGVAVPASAADNAEATG